MAYVIEIGVIRLEVGICGHLLRILLPFPLPVVEVLVKNSPDYKGHRSESEVVKRDVPVIEDALSRETVHEAEGHLWDCEDHVLVKEV